MKAIKIISIVFSIIGVTFLAVAAFFYVGTSSFLGAATRADGVVIDMKVENSTSNRGTRRFYYPITEFTTSSGERVRVTSDVGSNPPAFDVGEKVQVLYDPDDPADASIDTFWTLWLFPIIFGGIGLIFGSIGGGMLFYLIRRKRMIADLLATGERIETQLQGVEINRRVRVNRQHPYVLTSQWLDPRTNQVHQFKSEDIWYDPTEYLTDESIPVLIDPGNPRRYHMDTSFLPNPARTRD